MKVKAKCKTCGYETELPATWFVTRRIVDRMLVREPSDTAYCYHKTNGRYCLSNSVSKK